MWFDSWSDLGRVLAVGAAAYVTLVVILRLSGKRTLSKLNAFDLVVTVALGSTLATIVLSSDVSWSEGAVALLLLAVLQVVVSWSTSHVAGARAVVTGEPTLLVRDGTMLQEKMRRRRVTEDEIRQAARAAGVGGLDQVAAVVLETDGSLSVVTQQQRGDGSALRGVT